MFDITSLIVGAIAGAIIMAAAILLVEGTTLFRNRRALGRLTQLRQQADQEGREP